MRRGLDDRRVGSGLVSEPFTMDDYVWYFLQNLLRGYVGGRSAYAPLHIRGARPREAEAAATSPYLGLSIGSR